MSVYFFRVYFFFAMEKPHAGLMNMSTREQRVGNPSAYGVLSLWAPRTPSTAMGNITDNANGTGLAHSHGRYGPEQVSSPSIAMHELTVRRDNAVGPRLAHYYGKYGPGPAITSSTAMNNITFIGSNV